MEQQLVILLINNSFLSYSPSEKDCQRKEEKKFLLTALGCPPLDLSLDTESQATTSLF